LRKGAIDSVKYIFVTGGVVSGLGKGITAASLGRLLKQRGLNVTLQKFDPYLNVDPGDMSPLQHGEVFVTDDGAETDLDLGHYERFTDVNLTVNSSTTSGKIYWSLLDKARCGGFPGGTLQVIPHVTNEIKSRIYRAAETDADVVITEIGGTVGDIESLPILEAARQVTTEMGRQNVMFVHVSLIVNIPGSTELKSKPTQHSVKELLSLGIQPDVIVCRSELSVPNEIREKISLFCNIPSENVISNLNAPVLYEIPLMLEAEGLGNVVCKRLGLSCHAPDLTEWRAMVERAKHADTTVKIGLVGKYVALRDSYLSVAEALTHGGIENDVSVEIDWIDSELLTPENAAEILGGCDGILVPAGFGDRGIDGKIVAAQYAREHKVPYFGISLGMQVAMVEFARTVLGLKDAHSEEMNAQAPHAIIHIPPERKDGSDKGGPMRLGACPCRIVDQQSIAYRAYGQEEITERHRHRYEFNNDYREAFQNAGVRFSGVSPDGSLVEIAELIDHPWFVGVQYHAELKSRPNRAHPLFREFVGAARVHKEQ
jgi:CTP synthase